MVQEFKFLGIRIKAFAILTRGVADLSNKTLKVMFILRQKFQTSYIYPELHFRLFCYVCQTEITLLLWSLKPIHNESLDKIGKDSSYKLEELYEDFVPEKVIPNLQIHNRVQWIRTQKYRSLRWNWLFNAFMPVQLNTGSNYMMHLINFNVINR